MINRYLTINSIDRQSDQTPSNFTINIRTGLQYKTCKLILAQIPNTYFNITDYNNKIIINGVTKSMSPGNYNLTEFFTAFININMKGNTKVACEPVASNPPIAMANCK